ncbi:MAG: glycosyltransferase, partial [Planctomycetota bacterium]
LSAATRLRPGTLQAMLSCAGRRPVVGIVGCRVVARRGDPLDRGRALGALEGASMGASISCGSTECETTFVSGACMLVDAAVLRLGLRRDPSYQRSGSDADLCLRVRAIGRAIWVTQAATVECDDDQVVRSGQIRGHARDQVRLALRTRGWFGMLRFLVEAFLLHPLAAVLSGRGLRQLPAYFGGLVAGLAEKPHA